MPIIFGFLYLPYNWEDLLYAIRRDMLWNYELKFKKGEDDDASEEFAVDYRVKDDHDFFFDEDIYLINREEEEELTKLAWFADDFEFDDDFFMDLLWVCFFFYFFIDSSLCLIFFMIFYEFFYIFYAEEMLDLELGASQAVFYTNMDVSFFFRKPLEFSEWQEPLFEEFYGYQVEKCANSRYFSRFQKKFFEWGGK